jgi:hypothetical protein
VSERQAVVEPQMDPKTSNPRYLNADGERALRRALKTLDSHPNRSTAVLFDTLLDMGDWHMVRSAPEEAAPYYQRAAGLLDQIEADQSAEARAKLSFPVQVYYAVPLLATRYLNRPLEEVDQRFVHVAFTVGADGAVHDERVIEEDASPRQVSETLAAIRAARYRPKFVNGEAIDTPDMRIRQVFRQRKERDTE